MGIDKALQVYKESRKELKQGIRRAKRSHEKLLADRIKENPKAFCTYIKSKRIARERVGPLKDKGGNVRVDPEEGSVLGPLLFVIYINDVEENLAYLISEVEDDTKIGGVADSEEDCQRIQQDIDQLEAWAE
eukprot:g33323.t1